MKIDEEIKSTFENEYHRALVNLIYTHNYVTDQVAAALKSHNITRQQYNVLRILRGQHPKPAPLLLIKDRMLDKMSDASRIIDRLLKKELVSKSVCPSDRRSADILITEAGLKILSDLDPEMKNYNLLINSLTPEEAESLNNLLDKIRTKKA